jgi:pyrimidine deaminase RibD-like protein
MAWLKLRLSAAPLVPAAKNSRKLVYNPFNMDPELKQKVLKYADTAYAAVYHTSLQRAAQEIAATTNNLASSGKILSGETIVKVAKIQGDHINTVVQAKADALLDAYELYCAEIDNSILIEANQLRWALIDAISQNYQTASLPPGVPAFEMFKPQLVTNTGAIINSIECQIERRKLIPKLKKPEERSNLTGISSTVDEDRRFAQMAIEEARKSVPEDGRAHPKVGAVIVKDSKIVSKAHRGENPKCHAEYIALENKLPDDLIAGATVYTTLEPCTTRNHPKIPCAKRLIERKVARVVIGMLDPNPDIRGLGEQLLSDANIETQLFPRDLKAQVEELNREFIREQRQKQEEKKQEPKTPVVMSVPAADPKIDSILKSKGKVVTVLSRQKYGHGYLEGYWANGAIVIDCNANWVELEDPGTKQRQSFSLSKVTVSFDNQNNRLRLEVER